MRGSLNQILDAAFELEQGDGDELEQGEGDTAG